MCDGHKCCPTADRLDCRISICMASQPFDGTVLNNPVYNNSQTAAPKIKGMDRCKIFKWHFKVIENQEILCYRVRKSRRTLQNKVRINVDPVQ